MLTPENKQWLADFKKRYGRAPRILHVGNIANNAYNNARLLNEAGLDCDVICYGYYHIMGCPEWEDADIEGEIADQFKPDWTKVNLKGFERPRWFAQGPALDCINYLIARREGSVRQTKARWRKLAVLNGTRSPERIDLVFLWWSRVKQKAKGVLDVFPYISSTSGIASKIARMCDEGRVSSFSNKEIVRLFSAWGLITVALAIRIVGRLLRPRRAIFDIRAANLAKKFSEVFPLRADALSVVEMEEYRHIAHHWERLFKYYDIVQAYATDPILPMVAGKQPYIGFEHGTLRSHTLGDEPICRLTSLSYHLADHVFITNGDCLEYARKIGVTRYRPMLHPVDERRVDSVGGTGLRGKLGVKSVFLCTLRHDWAIKGTNQYILALPDLVKVLGRDFRVIMMRWGAELEQSKILAQSLGVEELILWSEPLPRLRLIQTLKSVDCFSIKLLCRVSVLLRRRESLPGCL